MNHDEAKQILRLYRPGTADADDPQIAVARGLAKRDDELGNWLRKHLAQQDVIRDKFRRTPVPKGLKEQILSEEAARQRRMYWQPRLAWAAVAMLVLLASLAMFWFPYSRKDDTLAIFQNRMAGIALRGYAMDLVTNSPEQVRSHLARNHAPADFVLPAALQKATLIGCAVETWQDVKVSMVCFRTGRPLAPGQQSDLWLFVVDRASVRGFPPDAVKQISKVNRLMTAAWTQGDKLYLLGTEGDERMIEQFL